MRKGSKCYLNTKVDRSLTHPSLGVYVVVVRRPRFVTSILPVRMCLLLSHVCLIIVNNS